ncbi:uncharacterized protein LOC121736912 [Aricia agestis]|uniref:uncharacterized protein LOC121736912 n=1 Tax=Aricia agestis TaxID=91739 RepID=UPI001C20AC5C|nr:uncharacterized protein LOC121736912 [Aricia agestis]
MESDSLQVLPVDQWHKLKDVLRRRWPQHVSGYTALDTMEVIVQRGCDYAFTVYCPFGDVGNGMVAVNNKEGLIEYIIQCPKDKTDVLEKAMRTTNILNHPKFEVPFVSEHVMDVVGRIIKEEWNAKVDYVCTTETYLLNRSTPFDVELPPDFVFKHMTLDYIELVDSVWPHRYDKSKWYFELLTKAKLGYGLFHKDELLAWVYIKEMGALGHLYTLEKHRRKGYAELIVKLIANILMEQGKTTFAFCVVGNTTAKNMYIKLGFDSVEDVTWNGFTR